MTFSLPKLPYSVDALEPYISGSTLIYHHGKHHAAYVDKLNGLVDGSPLADRTLEEVILEVKGDPDNVAVFNNAAQAWNHAFYWNCMTPNGGGRPGKELGERIAKNFQGFDNFRSQFIAAASAQFGSGWAWLVLDDGQLRITATSNAETPIAQGQHALLTCDVWEHAYYLDYQNRRGDYVEMFLEKLVNWPFVERQLVEAERQAAAA